MKRRSVLIALGASALVVPLQARGQQKGFHRIGYLANDRDPRKFSATFKAFVAGLQERGWVEGKNIEILDKASGGQNERFPELVAELIHARVDVIVAGGSPATRAAKAATDSIPIVFGSAGNPVEQKFVASLARPGGNVTGLSLLVRELGPKRQELLRDILQPEAPKGIPPKAPRLRFARMYQPKSIDDETEKKVLQENDAAAQEMGISLRHIPVMKFEEVEPAFAAAAKDRIDAIFVTAAGVFVGNRKETAQLALKYRLPMLGPDGRFAEEGALLSYGEDFPARYKRTALIVDKILRGTKPADIPVEEPAIYELVVNHATAKALGIKVPQSFLAAVTREVR